MSGGVEAGAATSSSPHNATGGARPQGEVRPREAPGCLHCGSPLLTASARAAGFCCAGCAYVHHLVREGGYEQYYRLKDRVIPPVDSGLFQPRDYGWLETAQREAEAAASGRTPELVLDLQGISCVGCVWLIERLFEREPGAGRIELNAQLGRLRLKWQTGRFDAVRFARALQSFGYLVGPPGAEPAEPAESRDLGKRIGLCTAFAMNVMLFTLPSYFGMTAAFPYARLFGTLAMAFGTLSFLAGGSYFLGRAVRALRDRVAHIDLPIALGVAGAYAGSVYGWLAEDARFVYFDFVASFVLLMLIGRWAQVAAVERNRRRLLRHQLHPPRVRLYDAAGAPAEEVAVEALPAGRIFGVPMGHLVPVEARLVGADAVFTTAWVNGESEPRPFRADQRVPAGAVNVTRGEVRLEALQTWEESLLARLLRTEARPGYRHRAFERVIQGYLFAILGLALAAGIGWMVTTGDGQRALSVAIAVLVVSCPCALGLALPLADEVATTAARRHGVFVRENDLWARLGGVRKIIFDKTGTLTLETPALANPEALRELAAADQCALYTLVRGSPHPVSQCLHEQLLLTGGALEPREGVVREEIGFGVSLRAADDVWTLGRPGWRGAPDSDVTYYVTNRGEEAGLGETEFRRNGTVLAQFRFGEAARADARIELAALRATGREVYLLSGDRRAKVDALARELGLPPAQAVAEAPPEEKAAWVRRLDRQDTLMLGDGANDSLAFESAHCRGTPVVHRGVLESKADFYYLGRGIGGIRRLLEINRTRARTQRAILVFAVTYNIVAVGLAMAGHMSPLLAAVLMPASSLLTLGIVGVGLRSCLRR